MPVVCISPVSLLPVPCGTNTFHIVLALLFSSMDVPPLKTCKQVLKTSLEITFVPEKRAFISFPQNAIFSLAFLHGIDNKLPFPFLRYNVHNMYNAHNMCKAQNTYNAHNMCNAHNTYNAHNMCMKKGCPKTVTLFLSILLMISRKVWR